MAERILIVEDIKNLRYDLRRLVEKARPGCDILEAENEKEAVKLIKRALFSLILADIIYQDDRFVINRKWNFSFFNNRYRAYPCPIITI